jgi:hypothetical protein
MVEMEKGRNFGNFCIIAIVGIFIIKITIDAYIDFLLNRELDPSKVAIIREVYDTDNAHETFELELERALEAGCNIIVVEPSRLGDETARWIAVGNCLHKTAILSGIGAIATGRYYC